MALGQEPTPAGGTLEAGLEQLAGWMDAHHTVLLHSVVEHTPVHMLIQAAERGDLSAGPQAMALCLKRLAWLREEVTLKFGEFRDKWRQRLDEAMLMPFLRKNSWFQTAEGGHQLASGGGRKEAKMLYLQTLHDMSADCERQVASVGGHIARIQNDVATAWHRESVRDNATRILPALEAVLRQGEAEAFKKLRLHLGDLAQEHFTAKVAKVEIKVYPSESQLFHSLAAPWHVPPRTSNGFEGFMQRFADLSEALSMAMLDHYQAKWELFLRGVFPRFQAKLAAAPSVPESDSPSDLSSAPSLGSAPADSMTLAPSSPQNQET
jgi:hypothetical protein